MSGFVVWLIGMCIVVALIVYINVSYSNWIDKECERRENKFNRRYGSDDPLKRCP